MSSIADGEFKESWQHTQNPEYISLIRQRIESVDLVWVDQFLEIIGQEIVSSESLSIKDIGCQAFQFYKQIKKRSLGYDYYGYELDRNYVNIGLEYFPELKNKIVIGDFSARSDVKQTQVSVCSATLEHVDEWKAFLKNLTASTSNLIVLRTFLGDESVRTAVKPIHAEMAYPIWQFGFNEFFDHIAQLGWQAEVRRDRFTDSMPVYKVYGNDAVGVLRTQYVVVCKPNEKVN